jgi:flavin-binding protein dodecin
MLECRPDPHVLRETMANNALNWATTIGRKRDDLLIAQLCIGMRFADDYHKEKGGGSAMAEHLYKVVEIIGTSSESFEKAAAAAVEAAAQHLKDLRIAEVVSLDMQVADGKVAAYRAKVKLSFKYHPEMHGLGA